MRKVKTQTGIGFRESNNVRITVSVPAIIDTFLRKQIPKRQVSQFVSEAIAEKIPEVVAKKKKFHPLEEFYTLRKKFKSEMTSEEIITAIHKGRK